MKIMSYRYLPGARGVVHVDAPIDAARITTLRGYVVIGLARPTGDEWRLMLDRRDVGVLGGALSRLPHVGGSLLRVQ